jgi:hypothetical protein
VPGRITTTLTGSNVVFPNATITLAGWTAGGSTTGTENDLTFDLYVDDATCSGASVWSSTVDVVAAGVQTTANTTYGVTGNHTYKWRIQYAGNSVNLPSGINCTMGFVVSSFSNS